MKYLYGEGVTGQRLNLNFLPPFPPPHIHMTCHGHFSSSTFRSCTFQHFFRGDIFLGDLGET